MIIEVLVAILLFVLFRWLAVRLKSGDRPKGRLWNLLEVFLLYIRDQVARPAIGHHGRTIETVAIQADARDRRSARRLRRHQRILG